jgi:hypothetical protein
MTYRFPLHRHSANSFDSAQATGNRLSSAFRYFDYFDIVPLLQGCQRTFSPATIVFMTGCGATGLTWRDLASFLLLSVRNEA